MITLPDLWNPAICGRTGNQLFQIAAACAHAIRTGHELVLPECDITTKIAGPIRTVPKEQMPRPTMVWREPGFRYDPIPYPSRDSVLALHGYFQSDAYWFEHEQEVRRCLHPGDALYQAARDAMHRFGRCQVAIGVRRTDYLEKQDYHPVLPLSYYQQAVALFPDAKGFVIFSDDVPWCKENLQELGVALQFCEEKDAWKKLWMMSFADHHIIANSSYHWWGARLNLSRQKSVVAPTTWFGPAARLDTKDLVPAGWTRL